VLRHSIDREREREIAHLFNEDIYIFSSFKARRAVALSAARSEMRFKRVQRRHHKEKRRRRRNKFERRTRGIFTNEYAHTQQHAFFLLHVPKRTPEDDPMKALKVAL
jgi:hypothetical protein